MNFNLPGRFYGKFMVTFRQRAPLFKTDTSFIS